MSEIRVQWLSSDPTLFEIDWLSYLFSDTKGQIEVFFNASEVKTDKDTVLICNHAVPYREVLDKLRYNGKKYVLVSLSDENLIDPCEWLHDPHCIKSFRNYIHPALIKHPKVTTFGLGYKRELQNYIKSIKVERDTIWCFAGTPHGERASMLSLFKDLAPNKTHCCSGFGAKDGLETQEYARILKQSKYALCPPGQDSMDSFRLYEALEAGCIPVTLKYSNQFKIYPSYWHGIFYGEYELPFIMEESWEDCVNKVKTISESEFLNKQKECNTLWNKWKNVWKHEISKSCSNLFKHL